MDSITTARMKATIIVFFGLMMATPLGVASYTQLPGSARLSASSQGASPSIAPVPKKAKGIHWRPVLRESLEFLLFENSYRLLQKQTREGLRGPFFRDWGNSITGIHGWNDGDPFITNYIAHPMEGAVAGDFLTQNDPKGKTVEFGKSKRYWISRLKAMGWAAVYSTAFEIGPISEASIGNVGLMKGTDGWVDYFVTPLGGFGLMILEDALDRFVLEKLIARNTNPWKIGLYRILFNPSRSFSILMDGRIPFPFPPKSPKQAMAKNPKPSIYDFTAPPEGWDRFAWPVAIPERGPSSRSACKPSKKPVQFDSDISGTLYHPA